MNNVIVSLKDYTSLADAEFISEEKLDPDNLLETLHKVEDKYIMTGGISIF